ncbi:MAG: dihydrofolate reductase [Bacillota bacterium]
MKLIASVDSNWGLGCGGSLLFRIPDDLKRFRALTTGNVVVMGRKTLESLPNGPLPNRENIVLTREGGAGIPGAHTCGTLEELWKILRNPAFAGKETFVIGGAQIYALLLPYCEEALITHVRACREADCLLPALSQFEDWALADISPWQEYEGLCYAYATYVNLHPLPPG